MHFLCPSTCLVLLLALHTFSCTAATVLINSAESNATVTEGMAASVCVELMGQDDTNTLDFDMNVTLSVTFGTAGKYYYACSCFVINDRCNTQ